MLEDAKLELIKTLFIQECPIYKHVNNVRN